MFCSPPKCLALLSYHKKDCHAPRFCINIGVNTPAFYLGKDRETRFLRFLDRHSRTRSDSQGRPHRQRFSRARAGTIPAGEGGSRSNPQIPKSRLL